MILMILAAAFCGLAVLFHLLSIVAAAIRCKARSDALPAPPDAPPVTIIRPVCGVENHITETLNSTFALDYPDYEIIFCVASAKDPIIPIVEELLRKHPRARARLLVGDERISTNPKLNNCVKGWRGAAHDWIVIADSNVLMPPDYIQRLFVPWTEKTGLVCAPPIGGRPEGFWAELECAFLNTYQARAQYFADTVGLGFAQGKTMFWRRAVLDQAAGFARSRPTSPRTPRPPKWCARRAARCSLSIAPSSNRSAIAARSTCGGANRAGRGCAAPASRISSCRKSPPAEFSR